MIMHPQQKYLKLYVTTIILTLSTLNRKALLGLGVNLAARVVRSRTHCTFLVPSLGLGVGLILREQQPRGIDYP